MSMSQHILKTKVLEEIEVLNGLPPRYDRFPWVLPRDADDAYFGFYMPSYNEAYFNSCVYAGDVNSPNQIARPAYYWDAEVRKWYPSDPTCIPDSTDSEMVYSNEDFEEEMRKQDEAEELQKEEEFKDWYDEYYIGGYSAYLEEQEEEFERLQEKQQMWLEVEN